MAVYTIPFTVTGMTVSPAEPQDAGCYGDDGAAELIFTFTEAPPADGAYRLEITDGGGAYDITGLLTPENGVLTCAVPSSWTAPGVAAVRLILVRTGEDGTQIEVCHYPPVHLAFADREDGEPQGPALPAWQTVMTACETGEADRVAAEAEREEQETGRERAEAEREQNEAARETAEAGRVSAEAGRAEAEQERVIAESERQGDITQLQEDMTTLEDAQTAYLSLAAPPTSATVGKIGDIAIVSGDGSYNTYMCVYAFAGGGTIAPSYTWKCLTDSGTSAGLQMERLVITLPENVQSVTLFTKKSYKKVAVYASMTATTAGDKATVTVNGKAFSEKTDAVTVGYPLTSYTELTPVPESPYSYSALMWKKGNALMTTFLSEGHTETIESLTYSLPTEGNTFNSAKTYFLLEVWQ